MAPTHSDERPRLVDEQILAAFDGASLSTRRPSANASSIQGSQRQRFVRSSGRSGVQPSTEAVTWRYFDRPDRGVVGFPLEVLPDFQFASVPMSVEEYRAWRSQTEDLADREGWDPDDAWGQAWIPIFGTDGSGLVVLDSRGAADGPSAVRTVRPDTIFAPDHAPVIARSFGELLAGAVRWMRQATCRFEPERRSCWPVQAWASQSHAERYARSEDA